MRNDFNIYKVRVQVVHFLLQFWGCDVWIRHTNHDHTSVRIEKVCTVKVEQTVDKKSGGNTDTKI